MKKLLLAMLMMVFCSITFAQAPAAAPAAKPAMEKKVAHAKQVQNPAAYACPKCYAISKGAGQCEHCKADKVQLGTYYCPACMKSSGAKAGKCAACGGVTAQMTRKLCAKNKMKMPA